jgi:hypothetical protein
MSNGEVVKIIVTSGDTELIKSHGFGASMTIVNEVPWLKNADGTPYLGNLIWLAHELVLGMPEEEIDYLVYHEEAHIINGDMAVMGEVGGCVNMPPERLAAFEIRADAYAIERVGKEVAGRTMKKVLKLLGNVHGFTHEEVIDTFMVRQPGRLEALM